MKFKNNGREYRLTHLSGLDFLKRDLYYGQHLIIAVKNKPCLFVLQVKQI